MADKVSVLFLNPYRDSAVLLPPVSCNSIATELLAISKCSSQSPGSRGIWAALPLLHPSLSLAANLSRSRRIACKSRHAKHKKSNSEGPKKANFLGATFTTLCFGFCVRAVSSLELGHVAILATFVGPLDAFSMSAHGPEAARSAVQGGWGNGK